MFWGRNVWPQLKGQTFVAALPYYQEPICTTQDCAPSHNDPLPNHVHPLHMIYAAACSLQITWIPQKTSPLTIQTNLAYKFISANQPHSTHIALTRKTFNLSIFAFTIPFLPSKISFTFNTQNASFPSFLMGSPGIELESPEITNRRKILKIKMFN